ncbi:MAG: restriction endonuclease [Burkholderiaceae bacterium]
MANVRTLDFKLIDELFGMAGGYVLDFSDRTIARFFDEELNVDFDDPAYARDGTSKAKRLRCYLRTVDTLAAVSALKCLWAYRQALLADRGTADTTPNAEGRFLDLLNRIQGTAAPDGPAHARPPVTAFNAQRGRELQAELLGLACLDPHPRGYAFETFLTALFEHARLAPKEPFKLRGEQIDGSFEFGHEVYLVEAKWQSEPTQAKDLHVFHGKIEQKAAWTRGLFVSNSGFTEDGLHAFGRGKRLICMDGLDVHDMLERQLPLGDVLQRKIRRAAETGLPFHRVRDMFVR